MLLLELHRAIWNVLHRSHPPPSDGDFKVLCGGTHPSVVYYPLSECIDSLDPQSRCRCFSLYQSICNTWPAPLDVTITSQYNTIRHSHTRTLPQLPPLQYRRCRVRICWIIFGNACGCIRDAVLYTQSSCPITSQFRRSTTCTRFLL